MNRKGGISRKCIQKMLGYPTGALGENYAARTYDWAKDVINEFEEELKRKEGGCIRGVNLEYGTPIRFKRLLSNLRKTLDLPLSPQGPSSGHISVIEFQGKYGFPQGSLTGKSPEWKWARDMLAQLNSDLYEQGHIGTAWERKVPEIRRHLASLQKAEKLPVNELGRLNRKEVMTFFGLPSNQSTSIAESRAPKLKELFAEFDERIVKDGYSQYKGDAYEKKLREILGKKNIVLDKSSRRISRKWLAEEIGVSISEFSSFLHSPKISSIIEHKTREIHASQRKGKTKKYFTLFGAASINLGVTPYSEVHDRVFSFESLVSAYALEFSEKIATGFIAITNNVKSTPKSQYYRVKHFLLWLSGKRVYFDIIDCIKTNKRIDQVQFERACMEYHAELLQDNHSAPSNLALPIITKFGDAKIFPKYKFRRKTGEKRGKDRCHKQSILEAEKKTESENALAVLEDAARYRGIEIESRKDARLFIQTLLYEKSRRDDLPDDLSAAMLQISKERLLEIRKKASIQFKSWQDKHKKSELLISDAAYSGREIATMLDKYRGDKKSKGWRDIQAHLFPKNDDNASLSNLLAVIQYSYGGIPPNYEVTNEQFWGKLYSRFGGVCEVASYLLPTRKAVSSALTLYLCESGANVAVALVLPPGCVRNSEVPAHKKVVGRKDRAKGKTIYDDLPIKSTSKSCVSAVSALRYLDDATCFINRERGGNRQFIGLYYLRGKSQQILEHSFREDFKDICSTSNNLKKFRLVPSMLRPTVLLQAQLKHPTNLGVAQLIAQHESGSTTTGYTNKLPHRVNMEAHMLEYQQSMEFIFSRHVNDPHVKIGVTEADWKKRMNGAKATGLGVFCENQEIVESNGRKTKCTEIEKCIRCDRQRMLVSADVESISEMIMWKMSLDKYEDQWVSERLDRWTSIWIPWKAFFHVVLEEKMSRGKLSKIKKNAYSLVDERMKKDNFVLPEPW